jgi:hypothetical protein
MFLDALAFEKKGLFMRYLLTKMSSEKNLASYRIANIQVEHFIKAAKKYQEEYPPLLLIGDPPNIMKKWRASKVSLLQREKQLDKSIRKLLEEAVLRTLQSRNAKIRKGDVRAAIQKYVTKINVEFRKDFRKFIAAGYEAARKALSGEE